jgi:hypothetical protein
MKFIGKLLSKIETIPNKYFFGLIFLMVFITYGNSLFNGFVLDDLGQIVNNPNIQSLSNIFSFFYQGTFYAPGAANLGGIYYRPVLSSVFAINFAVWQGSAFGFHLFSIILHALNAALLFLLFKKFFSIENHHSNNFLSLLLSLVFLVHPVNAESIAYISSIDEPLYIFFLLVAIHLVFSWIEKNKVKSKKLFMVNLMVLLSLLSKESGILAIPVILVIVFLFSKDKLKTAVITLFSTFIFYLFLRLGLARMGASSYADAPPIVHATLSQRLLTVPYELFSYMRLILFPKDLFISQQFVIKFVTDPRFYTSLPIVLVVITLLTAAFIKLKSKPYIFFFLWTVLFFSMILNIYPLDFSLTERWVYGPLIGILGIFGVLILRIPEKYKKIQTLIFILLVLALPILIIRTVVRNKDWKDNMTIISHDLKLNPDSYELQGDYGTLIGNAGDIQGAKEHIERALELSPTWWTMYVNLGVIYEKEQNYEKAKELYALVFNKTNDFETYEKLAVLKYKTEGPQTAVDFAIAGLRFYPSSPTLNFIAALSYYKLGDKINALNYAQKTYYLHPSNQTSTAIQRISGGLGVDDLLK